MKKPKSTKPRQLQSLDPKTLAQVVGGQRIVLFLVPPTEIVAK